MRIFISSFELSKQGSVCRHLVDDDVVGELGLPTQVPINKEAVYMSGCEWETISSVFPTDAEVRGLCHSLWMSPPLSFLLAPGLGQSLSVVTCDAAIEGHASACVTAV